MAQTRGEAIQNGLGATASFVSWGTLVSGALFFALLCLAVPWRSALWFVLLMYAHEAGHVLAARCVRRPVVRAPLFIPGMGAYINVGHSQSVTGDVVVYLAGPLAGGAAAVATLLAARAVEGPNPTSDVALAAGFALCVHVLNLLPVRTLDGGGVAAHGGWAGLALVVAAALALLRIGIGWPFNVLAVACVFLAYRQVKRDVPIFRQIAVAAALLAVAGAGALAVVAFWPVPLWGAALFLLRSPANTRIVNAVFWLYLASITVRAVVRHRQVPLRLRYALEALLGWPQDLMGNGWRIPVTWSVALHLAGLPGMRLLLRLIRYWSDRGDPAAGAAAAFGYDALSPDESARGAWLEQVSPMLRRAQLILRFNGALDDLGRADIVWDWMVRQTPHLSPIERESLLEALRPEQANLLAWRLLASGSSSHAAPFAERAVAAQPQDWAFLDTLARVRFAMDDPAAAEALLRKALSIQEHVGSRVALARALAAQGCYEDALIEATRALSSLAATWPEDEPSQDQVRAWIDEWRAITPSSAPASPGAQAAGAPV